MTAGYFWRHTKCFPTSTREHVKNAHSRRSVPFRILVHSIWVGAQESAFFNQGPGVRIVRNPGQGWANDLEFNLSETQFPPL